MDPCPVFYDHTVIGFLQSFSYPFVPKPDTVSFHIFRQYHYSSLSSTGVHVLKNSFSHRSSHRPVICTQYRESIPCSSFHTQYRNCKIHRSHDLFYFFGVYRCQKDSGRACLDFSANSCRLFLRRIISGKINIIYIYVQIFFSLFRTFYKSIPLIICILIKDHRINCRTFSLPGKNAIIVKTAQYHRCRKENTHNLPLIPFLFHNLFPPSPGVISSVFGRWMRTIVFSSGSLVISSPYSVPKYSWIR